MTESKIRTTVKYVVPTMLGSICFFLFTIIDGIFVGHGVGADGLGAVNLTMPFVMIVNALFMLFTAGGVTIVAVRFGEGDVRGANAAYTNAMLVALAVSAALSALGTFARSPLCRLLGANDTFFSMTRDYLFWYSVFIIPSGLATALQGFVRNDGDPILVSAGIIAGTLLNIFGDWLLIFPLGMGLKGAAIAMGVSQTVSLVITLFHFLKKSAQLHIFKNNKGVTLRGEAASGRATTGSANASFSASPCIHDSATRMSRVSKAEEIRENEVLVTTRMSENGYAALRIPNATASTVAMAESADTENALGIVAPHEARSETERSEVEEWSAVSAEVRKARPAKRVTPNKIISWSLIAEILLRGLPECLSKFTAPVTTFCLNSVLIARVGDIGVNAYSVISYVASFAVAVFFGTAEGLQPLFGHCYGARNVRSLHWYFRAGLLINVAGAALIEGLLFFIGGSVCRLFGIDGETLAYTVRVMPAYSWGYIAVVVTTITSAYLYSTTRTAQAVALNVVRSFVANVAVIMLLPRVFGDGVIWWCFLIYETIVAGVSLMIMRRVD